jgi:hypothetical protein
VYEQILRSCLAFPRAQGISALIGCSQGTLAHWGQDSSLAILEQVWEPSRLHGGFNETMHTMDLLRER